jgi:NAD(P)-dependent dehydrogenase (short-subunit alcohol dehydrogenase family)
MKTRVVFISGSGTGLGASLATFFSKQGDQVILHYYQSEKSAKRLASKIHPAAFFSGDLTQEKTCLELSKKIRSQFGRLDVLIHNSGVYTEKGLMNLNEEQWRKGFDTTATAAFFLTRSMIPLLRKSKHGRIVNIGDSSAERPTARDLSMSYHIGKTGLLMLTRSFAQQEARYGITCNMISPGWLKGSLGSLSKKQIPAGRYGTAFDIWNAIEFVLKPESDYLTGSHLVVSGGWNLR